MSFRDMGTIPAPIDMEPPSRESVQNLSPHVEQHPSSKSPMDQIAEALQDHRREHNVRKEKSLISSSTTVARYDKSIRLSVFSMLNDEIVQFQKMVNDLQKTIDLDIVTPEDQWRTRIMLKSAEEVDIYLDDQINNSPWNKQKDLTVQSSFSKLSRDFARVRRLYRSSIQKYHEKQKAEMALLSCQMEELPTVSTTEQRSKISVLKKEDFFDRIMREREEETKSINVKVHTVNQIYEALGRIVNDQQENIDKVEDQIRFARANTEVGLEHIEQRRSGMCGMQTTERDQPPVLTEDELHWSLPFRTFKHDIFEVQQDLADLVSVSARKLKKFRSNKHCQCGSDTTIDDLKPMDEFKPMDVISVVAQ